MKELYSHKVLTSFYLWFDYNLLNTAQAYKNVGGKLYSTPDARVPGTLLPFASPYKQWVYDSSVDGAQIPSGVYVNGVFTPRESGVFIDFDNGRVLREGDVSDSLSGNYSAKQFNTYIVTNEESKMIFDGNFNPLRYNMIPESGVNPIGYTAPACFIMNTLTDNKPFAFGGEQQTTNKMRVIVVTDDLYALDGCVSLFRDLTNSIIPLVGIKDSPFDEYGDLKSGVAFNYAALAEANKGRYLFIDKITATKVTSAAESKDNPNLRYGIIDFYLSEPRVPKLDL